MWMSNPFEITRVKDVPTMEMTLGIDGIVIFSYQIHIRMTDKIKKIIIFFINIYCRIENIQYFIFHDLYFCKII